MPVPRAFVHRIPTNSCSNYSRLGLGRRLVSRCRAFAFLSIQALRRELVHRVYHVASNLRHHLAEEIVTLEFVLNQRVLLGIATQSYSLLNELDRLRSSKKQVSWVIPYVAQ